MHTADFYRQNPWFRADDESFLMIFDAETGISEQIAAFDDLIEAPNWSKDGPLL